VLDDGAAPTAATPGPDRAESPRGRSRRRLGIRVGFGLLVVVMILGIAIGQLVAQSNGGQTPTTDLAAATQSTAPARATTTSSTLPPTTTTTIPALVQPAPTTLPVVPGGVTQKGDESIEVAAYEQRLADLHFDPGPIDGTFDQKTKYAVEAFEKLYGWPRDGVIDQPFVDTLAAFQYPQPLVATGEADRVEIDLDRQVLTVYKGWQVALVTTTSTGNGRRFCGGNDGCQYAVTPTGRYAFQWHVNGWRNGDLGRLYNPWYFNGGIAVHGYSSVPTQPASHGCARIPMHIAEYFGTLAYEDMAVYVMGTAAAPTGSAAPSGGGSSAPPPPTAAPPPAPPAPAPPESSTTTAPPAPTTTLAPPSSTTTTAAGP
jgi:peptidoglycan hydrolase-like protein with peptidoglycan-binding domain